MRIKAMTEVQTPLFEAEQGHGGAGTPPKNLAKPGQNSGQVDGPVLPAEILELLRQTKTEPELPLSDPDMLDTLAKAAEQTNAKRRARGRPEGSANRRNAEMFDYLEARGFKAPEVRLMEIISADPLELIQALGGQPTYDRAMQVLAMQAKFAAELMPYKFAKRQELKIEKTNKEMHLFVAGRMSAGLPGEVRGLDPTNGANEFNALSVRQTEGQSHETILIENNQIVNTSKAAD
jgi:hypothetical protein